MIMKINAFKKSCCAAALSLALLGWGTMADAAEFSASFKGTDINEFISTVGKNLNKNFIVDPAVRGKINVRSYDLLNEEEYYQFFLSVLEVYGYAVVETDHNVYKVVRSAVAKTAGVPVLENGGIGDEMITRVVPVKNVSVRELAPLLRGLIDNQGAGNVVHYEPSNVLLITGRAQVVNRLADIVSRVDKAGNQEVEIVKLEHASATEVVRVVNSIIKEDSSKSATSALLTPKMVADERTNSVVVSGEPRARERVIKIINKLDMDQAASGNTKVFYLRYAKAADVIETLNGVSKSITGADGASNGASASSKINIYSNEATNSIIVNAEPNYIKEVENIIRKLDIKRAQVLVEAIIVEVSDSTSASLGIQWGNTSGGIVQFTGSQVPVSSLVTTSGISSLANLNGGGIGFYNGNWFGLLSMVQADSRNDVLSTPSIITMDNEEAEFNVGQEVPVKTGTQTSTSEASVRYDTIERKTVGTKLKFVPQINEGDSVMLTLEQEVSSVNSNSANDENGATFDVRTIKNSVLVKSGDTVVLGGLMNNQTVESVTKVPFLGDIPLLGELFKYTSSSYEKRNLMVFLRPIILREDGDYAELSAAKYSMFRNEQLQRNKRGLRLLPITLSTPVMPELDSTIVIAPDVIQVVNSKEQN
ncbi:type II secretion system secretin GspD [uncultured Ruminobacter sp.]|uniref:type II secretion system secretin GspD n=1 Tax=Ruminobacter sp. TaxID=2774296 RepID=UPI0025DBBA0B|nr:type II secretion system secretin GspD [uncultured Ruminobacter sp.]